MSNDNSLIDSKAMFSLSYGLYVLTARDGGKDIGCIINTVTQITASPLRITIAVNKLNYTNELIKKTGVFNVSVLTTGAPFEVFKTFGFQSGRDADKFAACTDVERTANGVRYIPHYTNAVISARVIRSDDYETHTLFTAEVTEARTLSDRKSLTYAYYQEHIKPRPQPAETKKKGWVCKICGYVYEGETLPEDFICPICKHPASDFEPLT